MNQFPSLFGVLVAAALPTLYTAYRLLSRWLALQEVRESNRKVRDEALERISKLEAALKDTAAMCEKTARTVGGMAPQQRAGGL